VLICGSTSTIFVTATREPTYTPANAISLHRSLPWGCRLSPICIALHVGRSFPRVLSCHQRRGRNRSPRTSQKPLLRAARHPLWWLARIMHDAGYFCTSVESARGSIRSLDRCGSNLLCNAFGLICLGGGSSGHTAPPLKGRMEVGCAQQFGTTRLPGNWSAAGCGCARCARSRARRS
jgi:hypothetical protein